MAANNTEATMNPSLAAERKQATFPIREMTYLLHGGQKKTEMKEKVISILSSDPIFSKRDRHFLNRPQSYKRALQKASHAIEQTIAHGLKQEEAVELFLGMDEQFPLALHFSMFISAITSQGTEEQQQKWLPLAQSCSIIGCYAQTEMGHGSNVKGLETIATYDKSTQEFDIHSPTLTATKWWPGGLGKTATHCVTHTRLIIEGKDYGVHTFIVPIRSLEDHTALPGITVGDIGPKFGYDSQDNGFLRFDHVRVPRENLLMKFSQVSPEGTYTKPPKQFSKLGYASMVFIRSKIVEGAAADLAYACTIAIRYSAVRRQFHNTIEGVDNTKETQVLNYKMQQYRLLPLLAISYAFQFTGRYMANLYQTVISGLANSEDVSLLPELHASSAGLKAFTTWVMTQGIEECRQCCGGHGYSKFAGFSDKYVNIIPACTYEGDNVVMSLQTARYIMKSYRNHITKGGEVVGSMRYVSKNHPVKCRFTDLSQLEDINNHLEMFEVLVKNDVLKHWEIIKQKLEKGQVLKSIWNDIMIGLVQMARYHCFVIIITNFINEINKLDNGNPLKPVLAQLETLLTFYWIKNNLGSFLEFGYFNSAQVELLNQGLLKSLDVVRKNAVGLVDAWNFSDYELNSSLGRYNGDVYEHMYAWAQEAPMNESHQPPGYDEYLKPLLNGTLFAKIFENKSKL